VAPPRLADQSPYWAGAQSSTLIVRADRAGRTQQRMTTMDARSASTATTSRRSALAKCLLAIGTLTLALSVFSAGASAWEGSCYDYAPHPGAWQEFRIEMAGVDISQVTGGGQTFDDGSLRVVLSGAAASEGSAVTTANIASIDFTATPGVDAVYVRAGITTDNILIYAEPTTSGADLAATDRTTPIEWLTFCYSPETQPTTTTSTTTSTSTSTTTTTLATTTTTALQSVLDVSTTTAPTQVLGQQIERAQPELALTGARSAPLLVLGVVFIAAGIGIMVVNRVATQWRRTSCS
jgi:hypothetical protein